MDSNRKSNRSSISNLLQSRYDIPDTPTITSVSNSGLGAAFVFFTPATTGGLAENYTVISSPGNITATGTTSPIYIGNLDSSLGYTFQIRANNGTGSSAYSSSSSSTGISFSGSYESIQTVSVGVGGAPNISFTTIPSTYTNLQIRAMGRTGRSVGVVDDVFIRFNDDANSNYTTQGMWSQGSTIQGQSAASQTYAWTQLASNAATSNFQGMFIMDLYDYASTTKNKGYRAYGGCDSNLAGGQSIITSGMWMNTNAITKITIVPSTANFQRYSHFALYGMR